MRLCDDGYWKINSHHLKRRKIRRHLEIFENLFLHNMVDKRRPTFTCPGDNAGVEEVTSVTIRSEQHIYLRHWDNGERRKISSLTTIVWSFEDFFAYSIEIRTKGLKEDHEVMKIHGVQLENDLVGPHIEIWSLFGVIWFPVHNQLFRPLLCSLWHN